MNLHDSVAVSRQMAGIARASGAGVVGVFQQGQTRFFRVRLLATNAQARAAADAFSNTEGIKRVHLTRNDHLGQQILELEVREQ